MSSLNEPLRMSHGSDDVESGASYGRSSSSPSDAKTLKLYKTFLAIASILALLFLIITIALATRHTESPPDPNPSPPVTPPVSSSTGMDPYLPAVQVNPDVLQAVADDMDYSRDMTADPCNDWYRYSCGGWVDKTTIPEGSTQVTKGFGDAARENARTIQRILEEDWPLISPMYDSCLNVEAIERLSYSPINSTLHLLHPSSSPLTKPELFSLMGLLRHQLRIPLILQINVRGNTSDPRSAIPYLSIGGTTLTGANAWAQYVGPNNVTERLRAGIAAMLQHVGNSAMDADWWAREVVGFETELIRITQRAAIANANLSSLAEETWGAQDGVYTFEEAVALAPNVPMMEWLNGTGVMDVIRTVDRPIHAYLADNASFPLLDALIARTPTPALLAYAYWHTINATTPYLSLSFLNTYYSHFHDLMDLSPSLSPNTFPTAPPPRQPFCSNVVVNSMADLFGRYFVNRALPGDVKTTARDLITWIREAFERNLPSVGWMDEKTRGLAREKAFAVVELVGGPENGNWSDYSNVIIERDSFFRNFYQIQSLRSQEEWSQLTKPISRYNFGMNPSIVNAAYSPLANSMMFPAGILQSPFFNFDYPMALNLGRIGMVMGHELLHGFDNSGRQFDKDGYRQQWWDSDVIQRFEEKAQCLIDQYSNITVQGSKVSGSFTLGENIADNGGLHMAHLALQWYKNQLAMKGQSDPLPPSKNPLTTDQLFYWAYSQTWCTKATDAAIARQVVTDVHSPGEVRVWAPMPNQVGFAEAFNCPVGSRMNPAKKCDLY